MTVDLTPAQAQAVKTLEANLNRAVALHESGHLAAAKPIYELVLRTLPKHPVILDLYGTLQYQLGDPASAVDTLRRAVSIDPTLAAAFNHLGAAHRSMRDFDLALNAFQESLKLRPDQVEARLNLASTLSELKRYDEALPAADAALVIAPDDRAIQLRRGAILKNLGRYDEAIEVLTDVLSDHPDWSEAYFHLSGSFARSKHLRAGYDAIRRAILLTPDGHDFYGAIFGTRPPEPVELGWIARSGVKLAPHDARLWSNLTAENHTSGQYALGCENGRRALCMNPADKIAYTNLGTSLFMSGRFEEANAVCRCGLAVTQELGDLNFIAAQTYLAVGRVEEGWALWEHRSSVDKWSKRKGLPPRWDGAPFDGYLLVTAEQGVGDEMLFYSIIPDLLKTQKDLILEADDRMVPLFVRSFPGIHVVPRRIVQGDDGPIFDYDEVVSLTHPPAHVPSGALPATYRNDPSKDQSAPGYLRADHVERLYWRAYLQQLGDKPKVGICWRSGMRSVQRDTTYIEIEGFLPLLRDDRVTFVNLQYSDISDELERLETAHGYQVHNPEGIDQKEELDRLAALMSELDLVISVATSVACMAGALGVPTFKLGPGYHFERHDGGDPFFSSVRPMLRYRENWDIPLAVDRAVAALDVFLDTDR